MVMRYGPRLWKLRVLQAEIRMIIRSTTSPATIVSYTTLFLLSLKLCH